MINVYFYEDSQHDFFEKNINRILNFGGISKMYVIEQLESLKGGYFSNNRLKFQLRHLFSQEQGWEWPINEIICNRIYKVIIKNRLFRYGYIEQIKYQKLRRLKNVGIFKSKKKGDNKTCLNKICFYLCNK